MVRLSQAGVLVATAILVANFEESSANVFGRPRAFPRWFQGTSITTAVPQTHQSNILARLDVRGGAEEESTVVEQTVDAQDLYLPGLLDTIITRTNKVRGIYVSGIGPSRAYLICSHHIFSNTILVIAYNSSIGLYG